MNYMMSDQNPHPGDTRHSQIPVGCQTLPPPPPLRLDIGRCITRWAKPAIYICHKPSFRVEYCAIEAICAVLGLRSGRVSDDVATGRLVWLEGCLFSFCANKNPLRSGVTCNIVPRVLCLPREDPGYEVA